MTVIAASMLLIVCYCAVCSLAVCRQLELVRPVSKMSILLHSSATVTATAASAIKYANSKHYYYHHQHVLQHH
jgi:hypothetical protein